MCLSAGRGLPPAPHQRSQEMVPALITSFLEDGAGCGAAAGALRNSQPSPRCPGSERHRATCPACRCRRTQRGCAGQAEPNAPQDGQLFRASPLPHAAGGEGCSTPPAPFQRESFRRAASVPHRLQSVAGSPDTQTQLADPSWPSMGGKQPPGAEGEGATPQPSPSW